MNLIFDACSLINLVNGQVLGPALDAWSCRTGPLVQSECPSIASDLAKPITDGRLIILPDVPMSAAAFGALMSLHGLGLGETECIAFMQQSAELTVSCDDRTARTKLTQSFGTARVTGTLGLLLRLVQEGALDAPQAFSAYLQMKAAGGFLPHLSLAEFEALLE